MQGQRGTLGSFPEMFGLDRGSSTSNTGLSNQQFWNDMLNSVESGYQEHPLPANETNSVQGNAISHDGMGLNGWNSGEPSFNERPRDQMINNETKLEVGQSTYQSGSGIRLEERQNEAMITASLGSTNINLNSNQARNGSFLSNPSSSSQIHQNLGLNTGYTSNTVTGTQSIETGIPHMYEPVGLQTEHIYSAASSADPFVLASGNAGNLVDDSDGRPGCSSDGRRLSCKRKTLEGGVSGQTSLGGNPNCFPQADNHQWQSFPPRNDVVSSSNVSPQIVNPLALNPQEPLNPQPGVGLRGVVSEGYPALSLAGSAENSERDFLIRNNPANRQDFPPLSLTPTSHPQRHSRVWSPHNLSSRVIPSSQALDVRSAAVSSSSHSQSQITNNINRAPLNANPFPYNSPHPWFSGSSSSTDMPGESVIAMREEIHSRGIPRSISENPMFIPGTEMRNVTQNPTSRSLTIGSSSGPATLTSSSRVGTSSAIHRSPTSTWLPHQSSTSHSAQRLSETVRGSLYRSVGTESAAQSSNLPPSRSRPSSQEVLLSSATGQPGNRQLNPRSAIWANRQGDAVPFSIRSLPSAAEGRHRLLSEIRNVLDIVRRGGEGLRFEDVLILDQSVFFGAAELHDRHRDMRLDVDNMSYEELLALEERIGNVNTGLSEEIISKCLKQRKYYSIGINPPEEIEPCCICQEEYVEGEDLGKLDCGHDFHCECIKQWLKQKNACPVCKTTALVT